ncbi:MAG TPA: DUF3618 domain-containing protein [Nocardioidaceae bacterium]|nr:DUF3618 domain-containing protein [Nocardioidaceae bacterium]
MATHADRPPGTPESLVSEMDETRERLAQTIDLLVHRASPKTIVKREVATVKSYFVAADGSPRTDNILKVAGGVVGLLALVVTVRVVSR